MKKFLLNNLIFGFSFIVFFVLVNLLFLFIVSRTDWDYVKRIESIKFNNPEFELLVLGNSLALDGIDTELLTNSGIRSYNLAIGGSSPKTSYIQLKEYLEMYGHKPEIVILGLGSYVSRLDGSEIHPVVEFTMKDYRFKLKDIPIRKFKWLGLELAKKIISSQHRNARLSYGQLKFDKRKPDNTRPLTNKLNINAFLSSEYIGEIAGICARHDIKFIIIEMPGFNNTRNSSGIGPYLLNFSNGYQALLYNFNSASFCELFNPEQDWIANSHLNVKGASRFTGELYRILLLQKDSRDKQEISGSSSF